MITKYPYGPDRLEGQSINVNDIYKSWRDADIRADLQKNRSDLVMIYQNLSSDFNKASAIRSGNAFLVKESYFVGDKFYDKRGTVGTHHFENIYHANTFDEVFDKLNGIGYTIIAIDNRMEFNPCPLWLMELPVRTAFVFGEERLGLSDNIINKCFSIAYIEQKGSVRSLNVACAASICMYEYNRRFP